MDDCALASAHAQLCEAPHVRSKSKYRRRNVARDSKKIKAYGPWRVSVCNSYTHDARHKGTTVSVASQSLSHFHLKKYHLCVCLEWALLRRHCSFIISHNLCQRVTVRSILVLELRLDLSRIDRDIGSQFGKSCNYLTYGGYIRLWVGKQCSALKICLVGIRGLVRCQRVDSSRCDCLTTMAERGRGREGDSLIIYQFKCSSTCWQVVVHLYLCVYLQRPDDADQWCALIRILPEGCHTQYYPTPECMYFCRKEGHL